MVACLRLSCALALVAVLLRLVPVEGKHFAVFGGMMRSHHISVVPLIEALLEKGHEVSFVIPNTTEHKSFFPKGVGSAEMVYLGTKDWSFDNLFSDFDMDYKNMPKWKVPVLFARILWRYREAIDAPVFSMHDELLEWIKRPGLDAVVLHMASFGSRAVVESSGLPWVSFFAAPPLPMFTVHDEDEVCRYPNMLKPPSLAALKSSLVARVQNHMACRFLQGYCMLAAREINALFATRGLPGFPMRGMTKHLFSAPQMIVLGGPPLSQRVRIGPHVHLVGSVERPTPHPIPADTLAWLDAAQESTAPVIYISMGTKYELTAMTCAKLVALLQEMTATLGVRILWSLRASQQEKLSAHLPPQGALIRIEKFTPQPEVLAHAAVRVFLSHCGWGGVTDTVAAGVPVLGYPGMQDQFTNARMLEEARAGIVLKEDFSNLVGSTKTLLEDPKYSVASKAVGDALRSYGGLGRSIEIIEAAARGEYPEADPRVRTMMNDVDPFFDVPQILEQWISLATFVGVWLLSLLCCCCCACRCCCRCLCGRAGKAEAAGTAKKQQ